MNGLIRTELVRFATRRAIALLLLAAAVSAVVVAGVTAYDSRPPTASEIATAKAQAEIEEKRDDIQADLATCLADPAAYLGTGATQQQCRDVLVAAPKSYLPREPLSLNGTLKGNGLGLALLVAALLVIAASAYVGSDLTSGAIADQALFAPGRTALWTAKAAAVALWSLIVSTVVLGGFWVAMYLVAAGRDVPHGSEVVDNVVWHAVRAIAFCIAAALGSYALTTLFGHALATLGLLFVYSVGSEVLLALLPVDRIARWAPGNNVFGWLETRLEYFGGPSGCAGTDCAPRHLSHLDSGLYLLALVLLAVVAGLLSFRRRDL